MPRLPPRSDARMRHRRPTASTWISPSTWVLLAPPGNTAAEQLLEERRMLQGPVDDEPVHPFIEPDAVACR